LPRPVGSAFRVFVHPLSGFLLLNLWYHFSGPSVHGVLPFRVFLPLKSRAFLKASCSLALWRVAYGRVCNVARASEPFSLQGAALAG
jgi:hypothetical protein